MSRERIVAITLFCKHCKTQEVWMPTISDWTELRRIIGTTSIMSAVEYESHREAHMLVAEGEAIGQFFVEDRGEHWVKKPE